MAALKPDMLRHPRKGRATRDERIERMKQAYALHQQGRSYREIAAMLSLNKSTVQKYVNEAPEHLEDRDSETEIDRAISHLREATIGLWRELRDLSGRPGMRRAFARVALNSELRSNLLITVQLHGAKLPDLPPADILDGVLADIRREERDFLMPMPDPAPTPPRTDPHPITESDPDEDELAELDDEDWDWRDEGWGDDGGWMDRGFGV